MGLVTRLLAATGMLVAGSLGCSTAQSESRNMEEIVLGGGCFWCIEAVFAGLEGVEVAESGYMGGHIKNPAYREVCTGRTGHAEVVRVVFDADRIRLDDVLDVFFTAHDPTTLNRQGADAGTQYRSAIFYTSEAQLPAIEAAVQRAGLVWSNPIVTERTPATAFYPAEGYHQEYYALNGEAPYCKAVIAPKMHKVRQAFPHLQRAQER